MLFYHIKAMAIIITIIQLKNLPRHVLFALEISFQLKSALFIYARIEVLDFGLFKHSKMRGIYFI